ncbi:hypothetical protein ALI144C_23495 [Actinosynnema sp. ALI-1.44]|uniref:polyprenol phosphomannose-dependent alpha 1,6 mannosyltransferase MptB n=1 Tax=Actinosynnema sp. ALI-1.44 TaxID=1933779 RepID=UPI00097C2AF6|nr:polyprenol phosphomannose-dependent alpha 1,6 mannosyltransferase MptB [Actinosynnema sp. ALI-1.44]ONI80020.1 hypothetical protein ALI144C_23495 [Actinosynnema sp. ALI-1.44]
MPSRVTLWWGLLGSVAITAGSYGAGARVRLDPVLSGATLSTVSVYLGVGLLVTAWVRLGWAIRRGTAGTREVRRATLWWAVPLLVALPLFSTDLYSYLAQGVVAQSGANPYVTVPSSVSHPIIDSQPGSRWLDAISPYGPVFILVVKTAVAVTGGHLLPGVLLTRLMLAVGLVLLCVALPRLCRYLGGQPAHALWIGAANPFVLLHLLAGGHNDLLMVGLLAMGAVFVVDGAPVRGVALVATAAAVKVTAVVALPFLVWIWIARRRTKPVRVLVAAVFTVVGTFALWTVVTGVDLGWLSALGGNSWVDSWLSVPTAIGKLLSFVTGAQVLAVTRLGGWVLLAVLVTVLWWRSRDGGATAVRCATLALLATVLCCSVTFPWYFSWPLALGAAVRWSPSWNAAVAGMSVWLVLTCHPDGSTLLPWWGFAAVYAVAAVTLWTVRLGGFPGIRRSVKRQVVLGRA